jgi:hypothetical protein
MDTSIRSPPDDTYLIPDIRNGGIVSIAIFIVIYVDPITTQSNINTNQTFRLAIDRYNSTLARFKSESILGSFGAAYIVSCEASHTKVTVCL